MGTASPTRCATGPPEAPCDRPHRQPGGQRNHGHEERHDQCEAHQVSHNARPPCTDERGGRAVDLWSLAEDFLPEVLEPVGGDATGPPAAQGTGADLAMERVLHGVAVYRVSAVLPEGDAEDEQPPPPGHGSGDSQRRGTRGPPGSASTASRPRGAARDPPAGRGAPRPGWGRGPQRSTRG